jgi:hypothetical protein
LTSPNKKRSSIENESSSGKLNKFKVKYSGSRLIWSEIMLSFGWCDQIDQD